MEKTVTVLPEGGQALVADERLFSTPTWPMRTVEIRGDGSRAVVRPVLPADAAAIADLVRGLSDRSAYLRFHSPIHALSAAQLAGVLDVDHRERETLVAVVPGRRGRLRGDGPPRLVGFGQYVATGPTEVEVALLVADEWQGRRLGRGLAEALVAAAASEGYATFRASILAENRAALGLMRSLGFATEGMSAGSVLELVHTLRGPAEPAVADPTETSPAVRAAAG
ncbi:MAG: GNAT family N-acetyltransferase [Nitriliruptorales bacterium]